MPFYLIFADTDPSAMVEFGGLAMSGLSLLGSLFLFIVGLAVLAAIIMFVIDITRWQRCCTIWLNKGSSRWHTCLR